MGSFTQGSASRTYDRGIVHIGAGGVAQVEITIRNAAGRPVDQFTLTLPMSGAIVDSDGTQIAAGVPAAIANARNSFLAALDAAIDNAAAAGKFTR